MDAIEKKKRRNRRILTITFTVFSHIFSWLGPLIAVLIMFSEEIVKTKVGIWIVPLLVVAAVGLRFLLHRLNLAATEGVGMERAIAKEIKFLFPMIAILGISIMVAYGILEFHLILIWTVVSNIVAIPFRLLAYRFSRRYEKDLASIETSATLKSIARSIK